MALNSKAQTYLDQLRIDEFSKLATDDPELAEVFCNFAFAEVVDAGTLDLHRRLMVQIAATLACQNLSLFRTLCRGAHAAGVTFVKVKEIVYHGVPYLGMARVFDFNEALNDLIKECDIELPLPSQSTTVGDARMVMGKELQAVVAGAERLDKMYASSPSDLMHIQRFLTANCFGDTFTRGGLDLSTRELLTFTFLVGQGGCDGQVRGHVTGNLNVGNTREMLIDVLTQILPFVGYPRVLNGIAALNDIAPAIADA